jgi:uncharacterized membrane protein
MFGLFQKKAVEYFSDQEKEAIVEAIRKAEQRTSGEIRIYIESKCSLVNPVHRAKELFFGLQMDKTAERNAVLLYVAMKDRQLAIFGDEGIHQKVGYEFWNAEVKAMLSEFNLQHYADGFIKIINDIGEALVTHFPYDHKGDRNELPDDIVFGK